VPLEDSRNELHRQHSCAKLKIPFAAHRREPKRIEIQTSMEEFIEPLAASRELKHRMYAILARSGRPSDRAVGRAVTQVRFRLLDHTPHRKGVAITSLANKEDAVRWGGPIIGKWTFSVSQSLIKTACSFACVYYHP
jgi:hypothetical protein